uniref:Uncharacterized protein n=1 Tax=Leersia perrieri TaxID=77586 RepID=A0A0D9V8U1_9ORYZ
MEKQPFALPGGGSSSVRLVREGETPNVRRIRIDCLAHVVLLDYPVDQRNEEDIRSNCGRFGHLLEVDPACYAAPDMSPVRVVVQLQHPSEIPLEVRIRYGFEFRHVVPVQILRVWDRFLSVDGNGQYVPMYNPAAAARRPPRCSSGCQTGCCN